MGEQLKVSYGGAVGHALDRALSDWPETILYGEDLALPGGVFGVTRGLRAKHGDRVFDTPISETAMLGAAVGAAMMGRRPIVEIMWIDFALVAFDQIVNQAANVRYVSEGRLQAPLTIRTQQGTAAGACAQHSQNLEALLLHVPGIRVAMPTLPQDAHDLLLSAIACDDPVVVIENRSLYAGAKADIVVGDEPAPIGGHRLRRAGDDVTVVTWGSMTRSVETAVDEVAGEGISADVIEAVWLNPFDTEAVLASVERTGRLLVCHEANQTGGFGAEVVARVCESGVPLRTPPRRVATQDLRIPAAVALAEVALPQVDDIARALRQVMGR
ncbi:acetoin:2,6-dichlorophenolindophenol oxidoreductase subunit beta [Marmoricola sp. URHA0025 HA25]